MIIDYLSRVIEFQRGYQIYYTIIIYYMRERKIERERQREREKDRDRLRERENKRDREREKILSGYQIYNIYLWIFI